MADGAALEILLSRIKVDFNRRLNAVLYGLTPNEVLAGEVPDKKRYSEAIALARKKRVLVNRQVACVDSC